MVAILLTAVGGPAGDRNRVGSGVARTGWPWAAVGRGRAAAGWARLIAVLLAGITVVAGVAGAWRVDTLTTAGG